MKISRKARQQESDTPELDISSLIDVSFLLLIFFIVTSTLMKKETDLAMELPTPPLDSRIEPLEHLAIVIAGDGSITMGGQEMSGAWQDGEPGQIVEVREQLLEHRKRAELMGEKLLVSLAAADEAKTQRFVDVVNALAFAGIENIALAAK